MPASTTIAGMRMFRMARRSYSDPRSPIPDPRSRVISAALGRQSMGRAIRVSLTAAGMVALGLLSGGMLAQGGAQGAAAQGPNAPDAAWRTATPTNDAPNPYNTIEGWAKLPAGREWGSTSAVDIDKDGKSVWVGERCGTGPNPQGGEPRSLNSCWDA